MGDEAAAVEKIKLWLKEMTNYEEEIQNLDDDDDGADADDADPAPNDVINNDADVGNIVEAIVDNVRISADQFFNDEIFSGVVGSLTFGNRNYFVGEFSGSVFDREGILTRFDENGLKTTGTWKNGLLEVRQRFVTGCLEISPRPNLI